MRPQIVTILTFALTLCSQVPMLGQSVAGGPPPPSGGSRMPAPPPPELPLDSSLQLLLCVAVMFGAYWAFKLNAKKKVA